MGGPTSATLLTAVQQPAARLWALLLGGQVGGCYCYWVYLLLMSRLLVLLQLLQHVVDCGAQGATVNWPGLAKEILNDHKQVNRQ